MPVKSVSELKEKTRAKIEKQWKGSYSMGRFLTQIEKVIGPRKKIRRKLEALKLVERKMALGDKDARERFYELRGELWGLLMGAVADLQVVLKKNKLYKGKIDGIWGKNTEKGFKEYLKKRHQQKNKEVTKVQQDYEEGNKEKVVIYSDKQIIESIREMSSTRAEYYTLLFTAALIGNISLEAAEKELKAVTKENNPKEIKAIIEGYKNATKKYLLKSKDFERAMKAIKEFTRFLEKLGLRVPKISIKFKRIEHHQMYKALANLINEYKDLSEDEKLQRLQEDFKDLRRYKLQFKEYMTGNLTIEEVVHLSKEARANNVFTDALSGMSKDIAMSKSATKNIDLQLALYKKAKTLGKLSKGEYVVEDIEFA